MEAEIRRTPLPEICSVVGNRLAPPKQPQLFKKAKREGVAEELVLAAEALAEKRTGAKEITSVCTLKDNFFVLNPLRLAKFWYKKNACGTWLL